MKKKIVQRTYSILDGKPSDRISYIASPKSVFGNEQEHVSLQNAYLFNPDECYYNDGDLSGNDRTSGDYSYKQKVLNVNIEIGGNNK